MDDKQRRVRGLEFQRKGTASKRTSLYNQTQNDWLQFAPGSEQGNDEEPDIARAAAADAIMDMEEKKQPAAARSDRPAFHLRRKSRLKRKFPSQAHDSSKDDDRVLDGDGNVEEPDRSETDSGEYEELDPIEKGEESEKSLHSDKDEPPPSKKLKTDASTKPAEKWSQRLTSQEKDDFVASLEHIVTIGSYNREGYHRSRHVHNHPIHPLLLHAEDARIYENGADRKRQIISDKNWDIEHGDTVHPLAFAEARLSEQPPRDMGRIDGSNLLVETTDPTVSPVDVPRALLLRCWERAVHAASCTVDSVTSSEGTSAPVVENYDPKLAVEKCTALGIHLPNDDEEPLACPRCTVVFDSPEKLNQHFYGNPQQLRGCCWSLIHKKHLELLDETLQAEVKASVDSILHVLSSQLSDTSKINKWHDVLTTLKSFVEACRQTKSPTEEAVLGTIDVGEGKLPLVLNDQVLEAVTKRLTERYAYLPR